MSIVTRVLGLSTRAAANTATPPQGALQMPQYRLPNMPIYTQMDNPELLKNNYYNIYTYRCVNAIANSISSCPFRAGPAQNDTFQLNVPLARRLGPAPGGPNPYFSSAQQWRYSIVQRLLLGKFAWAISRDSLNRIDGLWPLMAQFVRPVPAPTGSTQIWKRFEYGNKGNPDYTEYSPDELFYSWRPSQEDWHLSESVLQGAGIHVQNMHLIDRYDNAFLRNGGVPAGLLITPPFASSGEKSKFEAQFVATFSGVDNANKVMLAEREVLSGDGNESPDAIEYKQIGITQRDSQLSLLRDAKIRDVTTAWGVPLSVIGDSGDAKFTNMQQDRRNYWNETCQPLMREIQDDINNYLAPSLGPQVGWFDTSDVPELQPISKFADLEAAGQLVAVEAAGGFDWNEWRESRGMPPLPEKPPELPQAPVLAINPPQATTDPFNAVPVPLRVASFDLRQAAVLRKGVAQNDTLIKMLDEYTAVFEQEQHRSLDAILSGARGKKLQDNPAEAFARGNWQQRGYELFSPVLRELGYTDERINEYVATSIIEAERTST